MKYNRPALGAATRVARSLLDDGPACASDLAERLNISPTAVRRHLDVLEEQEYVVAGDRPAFGPSPVRGRGRPARIYSLTDAGRQLFDQAYDDLAVSALRYLRSAGGDQAVADFAADRAHEVEQRYAPHLSGIDDGPHRAERLAQMLTQDGFAASTETGATGATQICQHNCPIAHAAHEFPELCDAELAAFGRLLGTNVTRLATLALGDGVCTSLVSPRPIPTQLTPNDPERISR